ncbi:MAG: ROK family protein [Deinococcus sp.]|nr:ROK family protein [Deinococcus sp.]
MSVVGVDLGGTKIAAGVLTQGKLVSEVTLPTPSEGADTVVWAMAEAARQAIAEARQEVKALGLGTPGPLDFRQGIIKFAPNIAGMNNFPVQKQLQQEVGLPVFIENDANAAALAEHHLGAARGSESSLFVTISTGIGGGFVIRNRVWRGAHGQGAEVGHLTVLPGGPVCGCGIDGCLEALAAGRALERDASYSYSKDISTPELFERFRQGEAKARRVVVQSARYVGLGLANLVKTFDPEVIVLGGGVALHGGEVYLAEVLASYQNYLRGWTASPVKLAELGTDAGLLGAALTAAVEVGEA